MTAQFPEFQETPWHAKLKAWLDQEFADGTNHTHDQYAYGSDLSSMASRVEDLEVYLNDYNPTDGFSIYMNGQRVFPSENEFALAAAQIPQFETYSDVWVNNVFTNVTFSGTGVMLNDPSLDTAWNNYNTFLADNKENPDYPDDQSLQYAGIMQSFVGIVLNVAELMKRMATYSLLSYTQSIQNSGQIAQLQSDVFDIKARLDALENP